MRHVHVHYTVECSDALGHGPWRASYMVLPVDIGVYPDGAPCQALIT